MWKYFIWHKNKQDKKNKETTMIDFPRWYYWSGVTTLGCLPIGPCIKGLNTKPANRVGPLREICCQRKVHRFLLQPGESGPGHDRETVESCSCNTKKTNEDGEYFKVKIFHKFLFGPSFYYQVVETECSPVPEDLTCDLLWPHRLRVSGTEGHTVKLKYTEDDLLPDRAV